MVGPESSQEPVACIGAARCQMIQELLTQDHRWLQVPYGFQVRVILSLGSHFTFLTVLLFSAHVFMTSDI